MALNAAALAGEMKIKMDAVADSYKDGAKDNSTILNALAEAIVEHITANAEVIVSGGSSAGAYPVT